MRQQQQLRMQIATKQLVEQRQYIEQIKRQHEAPAITLVQETQQQLAETAAWRTCMYRAKPTLARELGLDTKGNIHYDTVLVQL